MAITSVEKAKYIQQQQEYLSKAKIGQYSKFLDKNPLFVTYYPISHIASRVDAGIGNIAEYIGPASPMRYNKVLEVPAYNIPEMRPDVITDEGGYDISMDLSDIAFPPDTIRPRVGDIMLVQISGVRPLLFQCTEYSHATIQSNAFYLGAYTLLEVDQEYCTMLDKQVEETYTCKFENIGTNNKVLISTEASTNADEISELADTLAEFYTDAFFNEDIDGFVLYHGNSYDTQWYYDNYLTRFINESEIYVNDSSDYTITLPYLELRPLNFDIVYKRSLFNAVLEQSKKYLQQYMFAWDTLINNRTSPLALAGIPCLHPFIEMTDKYVFTKEAPPESLNDITYIPGKFCGWDGADPNLRPYFNQQLIDSILTNVANENLNPIEMMIYQYVTGGTTKVQFKGSDLIKTAFAVDNKFTFLHMPIVIYILRKMASATA